MRKLLSGHKTPRGVGVPYNQMPYDVFTAQGHYGVNHRSTISFTSLTSTISTSSSTGKDRRMDSFSTMSRGTFRTVTPSLTKSKVQGAPFCIASTFSIHLAHASL